MHSYVTQANVWLASRIRVDVFVPQRQGAREQQQIRVGDRVESLAVIFAVLA